MPTEVIMPKLGLTMESGTVQRWLAGEGNAVVAGDGLLEVETDKVVVEVESPATGTLGSVLVREGETVPIGTVLARIFAPGEQQSDGPDESGRRPAIVTSAPAAGPSPDPTTTTIQTTEQTRPAPENALHSSPNGSIVSKEAQQAGQRERTFSSPRARKRAQEAGLNWQDIPGSGPLGRVIERDVVRASSIVHGSSSAGNVVEGTPIPGQRMAASLNGSPHFHLSTEARVDELLKLCERLLPTIEGRTGIRLTVTDVLVKIAAVALAEHPRANAVWDPAEGKRTALQRPIHVGVAVATDGGLVVPVVRNADGMGLAEIAAERSRLVNKAREGRLSPGDLEGGAFALANLGMYRVDVFQAILTPLQTVILAAGRITERPVAVEGRIRVRPTMVLTLSCDSRMLNGSLGAQLLDRVVELIEEPYRLIV
jgi:pyruvate dehydrogenase E2 component (dihydrolipoamide acetyltransferase)